VSILHIESFENHSDEGLLAKTDAGASAGAGAGTVFLAVDSNVKELQCRAKICDHVFFREPGLDLNRGFGSVFWVQHRDVIDV